MTSVLVLLTMLGGGFALKGGREISAQINALTNDTMPGLQHVGLISANLYRLRGEFWKHLALNQPAKQSQIEAGLLDLQAELNSELEVYSAAITQAEDRANFSQLKQDLTSYLAAWKGVQQLSKEAKTDEAESLYLTSMDPYLQKAVSRLQRMQEWNDQYGKDASAKAKAAIDGTNMWNLSFLMISLFLGTGISFWLIRELNATLTKSISTLGATAAELTSAALQVSSTSQMLAQGASNQAASIEEVSAASEEVSSKTRQSADRTKSAGTIVKETQKSYDETFLKLNLMIESMSEINGHSGKIAQIIKVIDEIAFQTNILALNAAIEAARAGEAGQGFAVVADEVRSLSQRCAQAAQDTAGLIDESMAKSAEGKVRVDTVVVSVQHLHERANDIMKLLGEIGSASGEQAKGMDTVAKSLSALDRQTQNAATAAEEGASAAQQLASQAEALRASISELESLTKQQDRR